MKDKGGINMEINNENLENALSHKNSQPEATASENKATQMSKEMEIGFHQGALNTLSAERTELVKMIQNVEKIMGMHINRLERLGVKVKRSE